MNEYYKLYPRRDPVCVSHYPDPDIPVKPREAPGLMRLREEKAVEESAVIYFHVPFCRQICVFCPFNKTLYKEDEATRYVQLVKKEIAVYAESPYVQKLDIHSVYFGGGTPSTLSMRQITGLLETVRKKYRIHDSAQISFEGSPATLSKEMLQCLYSNGVNRISMGIQTFNDNMAEHIRLQHKAGLSVQTIENAFAAGFENVGIDLMYNLPGQGMREWLDDVQRAIALGIRHITLFSLCVVPFTVLNRLLKKGSVPAVGNENYEIDMFVAACELLLEAGYIQYSVWDFALPGFIDKHVMLYYSKQKELIAHGPAAFGYLNKFMYINAGSLDMYFNRLEKGYLPVVTGKRAALADERHGMMAKGLRMLSVSRNDFRELFGKDPGDFFKEKIAELEARGLLETTADEIRLSFRGRIWGNNVCKEFFSEENKQSFQHRMELAKGKDSRVIRGDK